jgi:hypothetical protein
VVSVLTAQRWTKRWPPRVRQVPLVVAKVDRLTRSVAFLSRLLEADVDGRFAESSDDRGGNCADMYRTARQACSSSEIRARLAVVRLQQNNWP